MTDNDCQRILIIDDLPELRRSLIRMLTGAGYEVESAMSGEEGLALVRRRGCDFAACVVDYGLPGMNGHEFASELKTECPDIPALIISGYRFPPPEGLKQIDKPFDPDELIAAVDALVAAARIANVASKGNASE